MDKICIVKLRKNMTNPQVFGQECGQASRAGEGHAVPGSSLPAADNQGLGGAQDRTGMTDGEKGAADKTVSLVLTPEQMGVLQSDPHLLALLSGAPVKGFAAPRQLDESIVFKFTIEAVPPVRLLKVEEVVHMLRISKGYLTKIVRRGELKSYKIGRLRRIMFEDILTYLEGNQDIANIRQRASITKVSQGRMV